ncbi:MAG TPA: TolC family protein, partial [Gammaproteobacteria bacterium]|nr:TolC family protein [Gammaproteobacteria bacterium]
DVETAIHFALLQHPRMKAAFAELGIARADLMKAGLLPNPVIELGAEIPDRSPQGMAIEFNILGSVVDLLLRPDNTRIKALAVDAAIIRFSAELMDFAAKVETAFVRLQGARHRHTLLREIDADARASADLAAEMRKTGNVAAVHAVRTAALAEQSGVHLLRAALAVDEAQAELSLLMGMGDPSDLPLGEALLPSLPSTPIRVEDALAIALTERLDLASARKAVEVEAAKHQISVDWGWLNAVQIGVSAERDTDRQFRIGPRLQADLPIFNRGQAERAQTAATLRRQQHGVETLALEIESQVRLAERRVQQTHSIAKKYEDKLLPLHEQIGALIQRQKDFMLIGTTDVVAARRDALMVSREYVHALGDYWIAVAELRRALGGRAITTE